MLLFGNCLVKGTFILERKRYCDICCIVSSLYVHTTATKIKEKNRFRFHFRSSINAAA